MADAGSNWSEWVNGGDEPRLVPDTENWYKSAGGARRGDLGATCYVTTCANGKQYETWVAKGAIDDHACSEKEGFGDTWEWRAEAFKAADAYELARPKDYWGDWMSYIPSRKRATACQSECNLFRLSLEYVPRGHPRRQYVEQRATALMTKAVTDVYGDKPIKLRLCRAVWKRVDEHIRQFCKPDICKRVGLRALAKFMDLDINAIRTLLDKDARAFKMVLGAMVCLMMKPDAAGPMENFKPEAVKLTQASTSKEDLLKFLTTSDVELVSKALCMHDQFYASIAGNGEEKEQLKDKTSGGGGGGVEAPAPKLGKRAPIPLEELDLSKIEFGKKVEKGNQGDQFVRATHLGERIELSLAALPKWSRAPFAAGPPKTADGAQLGTQWSFAVELTMEQYEKFAAYEAHVVKSLMPLRNELFPAEAKKKKGGMTEEAFADKYNSKLTPPNPEKGYAPTLRIFIETDTERQMPKIQLMHLLEGNKCTRPVQGNVNDLKAKSAVSVIISLSRGVYAGQTGLGCKFAGTVIDVLTNLQQSNAPEPDYSGVTQLVEEAPAALTDKEESEHPAFLPRKDGERWYVYPNQAWETRVYHAYEFFMQYRTGRDSRSADMQSISDWPKPLPFQIESGDSLFTQHLPSFVMEHISHKRSFSAQLIMIELRGALGWLDQQFHPFAPWKQHVHQLLKRSVYLTRHQTAPRSCTRTYKTAVRQLRTCAYAVENNDPEAFRRYMGIFSEKAFADELHSQNYKDASCLSSQLGELLLSMRDGSIGTDSFFELWVPNTDVVDERFANMFDLPLSASDERNTTIQSRWPKLWTWMVIINELAAKMDHVAVLVVDALCIGISSHIPPHQDPCFGQIVFHPGFKFALRAATVNKFTDTTTPTYYCPYWSSYTGSNAKLSMEAASREAVSFMPRARFPDTLYAEMIAHVQYMYELFLKRFRVNLNDSNGHMQNMYQVDEHIRDLTVFEEDLVMRRQIVKTIGHCHFGIWSRKEKLVAACAMIKYAQDQRQTMHTHQEAKLKEPVPTAHAFGVLTRRNEIYVNLDTARMLIDLVLASYNKDSDHCVYGEHAITFGIEFHNAKQAWLAEDAAFDRRVANAEKEERKRRARLARERESAVAATVHLCAKRACNAVVIRARVSDLKAKTSEHDRVQSLREHRLVQLDREFRARARISLHFSWAPRIVRRKAAHVQLVADNKAQRAREAVEELARTQERVRSVSVAVELNRAAAARREVALAQRAEDAKEAIALEAKEAKRAIARDAKDEKRARVLQRKAEQDERTARVQAQVEAEERARRAREAAEEAEAAARARIAEAAAEVEKARAREEAREAREREAARVAEEQRRRDEDEALQNELKRRDAQSKADRKLGHTLAKQKRAMLAAAFPQWREAAAAVKMARSMHKLRCAEQQRCNAIIREGLKQKADNKAEARARREEKVLHEREARVQADKAAKEALATEKAKVEAAAEKAAPAPKEFTEADVNHASSVSFARGEQWDADYRHELAVSRMESQKAWMTETGWATNRRVWYAMGGNPLVQHQQVYQQQQDVFAATFQANCKYMERIRNLEQKRTKEGLAQKWTISVQEHADKMAALDYEQKRLQELEAEISEVETQKEERLTRYVVLREYLDGLEAATEAERRKLSAQRCEQLRKRTEGSYDVSLAVNECVLCMSEPCSHIASGCFHVIGCEPCIVQHRNCHGNVCPICKAPTTFQKMHFP